MTLMKYQVSGIWYLEGPKGSFPRSTDQTPNTKYARAKRGLKC